MGDDSTGSPLKRRVPGAAGVGNVPSAHRALPDTLIARMQAAVDAAHEAQGEAEGEADAAADAEPATEPLPAFRSAVATPVWTTNESSRAGPSEDAWSFRLGNGIADPHYQSDEADALDDLAESYLHADPDLAAGYTDDAEPGTGLPSAGPEPRGWDAFGGGAGSGTIGPATTGPVEPGAGVTQQRAAWWDHAVQSGAARTARETRPSKARQRWRPVPGILPTPVIEPIPAPAPIPVPAPARAPEPAPAPELVSAPAPTAAPGSAPARRPARKPTPPVEPPAPARRSAPRRRGPAMAGVVALAVVLIAGGVVALALSSRSTTSAGPSARAIKEAKEKAAAARLASDLAQAVASAATWVAAQVDRTTVVACDPATCEALVQYGFPGGKLASIGTSASTRPKATLVIDTPAARRQLGTGFARDWAPAVLAGFGRGTDRITVRVIAPNRARAYRVALRADRKERQVLGSGLLTSGDIAVTAAARSAMAAGDVDSRLLVVITAMASQHPIDILAFGRTWSGTTIGIPLRTAYFGAFVPAAYLSQAEYVQAIIGLLKAQPTIYRPVHIATVHLDGRRALRVEFPAPSPLGLINPNL